MFRKDGANTTESLRYFHPARKIGVKMKGRATDSSYMEFASATDPAYYIDEKTFLFYLKWEAVLIMLMYLTLILV